MEQRLGKCAALDGVQPKKLVFLNGSRSGFLQTGDDEIRQRSPLQFSRLLKQRFLIAGDTRFQPIGASAVRRRGKQSRARSLCGFHWRSSVRQMAGMIQWGGIY